MAFVDNLADLSSVEHLTGVRLIAPDGREARIENKAGSQGSLRVYHHLAVKHGDIGPAAAAEGLSLYGEHTEDARLHPGKHPNIDRLFAILADGCAWSARIETAGTK